MPDPSRSASCTFRLESTGEMLRIMAVGALNESTANSLMAVADSPLNTSRRIVIVLAGVTELDSSGVYALVQLRERSLDLKLKNPPSRIAIVLKLAGLDVWIDDTS